MEKEFMKPWMKKCNPDLIYRFWVRKGCPGRLSIRRHGVDIVCIKTPHGVLHLKTGPITEPEFNWWKNNRSYEERKRMALEQHCIDMMLYEDFEITPGS